MNKIKFFALTTSTAFLFKSCNKQDQSNDKPNQPNKLFSMYVNSEIPASVRVFDAKTVKVNSSEKTVWVAFDCSQLFWMDYSGSLGLEPTSYFLSVIGGNVADTGFEGYLDDDYKAYANRKTKKGVFLVRKISDEMLRIV